jgi:transketolase N-terminal domain/subunit
MAALFFGEMRFDPHDPHNADADSFVLSKARRRFCMRLAEAGAFDRAELMNLRKIDSISRVSDTAASVRRRRHRLAGPGICAAVGIALNARRIKSDYRTYALLGDSETAEGSVWEAADTAACDSLDNLAASPTSTRSAKAGRRCGGTTWRRWPPLACVRLARSSSTDTTWPRSSMRSAKRSEPKAVRR